MFNESNSKYPDINSSEQPDAKRRLDTGWMKYASCKEIGVEVFFPDDPAEIDKVFEVCDNCPVRGECLDYAIENEEVWGVWGGKDFDRKRETARRNNR